MITYLQLVNRVLVKLRENEVTTLAGASAYTKLVAALVNEAKEDVETSWKWNSLRTTIPVTTVADTSTYSLTDSGEEFIIDTVWDATNNCQLIGPSPNHFIDAARENTTLATASNPMYFDLVGVDSNGDLQMRFTPTPSVSDQTINVYGRVKQEYLETDSDDNTLVKIPWRPVVFLAYSKALSERGEDGGVLYDEAVRDYERALSTAIGIDATYSHVNKDWYAE